MQCVDYESFNDLIIAICGNSINNNATMFQRRQSSDSRRFALKTNQSKASKAEPQSVDAVRCVAVQ